MNLQHINATTLGDAWFQTLFKILEEGSVFTIDRGSYAGQKRLEFDWVTIHVKHPSVRPLLPQIEAHHNIPNPVADDYLDDYLPYLMTAELKEGEIQGLETAHEYAKIAFEQLGYLTTIQL